MEHTVSDAAAVTEIKTRNLRPLECYAASVNEFHIYIRNGDRILEKGDVITFIGHNTDYVQMLVADTGGIRRWISIDPMSVFVEE